MSKYPLFETHNKSHLTFHHSISPTCEVDSHLHDGYEIFMSLSDELDYFVEGQVYTLQKGDIIITNDIELHRPQMHVATTYNRRFIQFSPLMFTQLTENDYQPLSLFTQRKLGHGNLIIKDLSKPAYTKALEAFEAIEMLSPFSTPRDLILADSYLLQLIIYLEICHKPTLSPDALKPVDERVKAMLKLLDHRFEKPLHLDSLCDELYVDKYYMSHLFKAATGFTMMEYLQSKRIQHAKKLLLEGLQASQVAQLSGFEDYSNFYKTFKKLMNCAPSQYMN